MNPISLEFPGEFETERLLIRKPLLGDGLAVYVAAQASLKIIKRRNSAYLVIRNKKGLIRRRNSAYWFEKFENGEI